MEITAVNLIYKHLFPKQVRTWENEVRSKLTLRPEASKQNPQEQKKQYSKMA